MFLTPLSRATSVERVGGKAAGACRVLALGIDVPRAVVLESGALRLYLEENSLWSRVVEYSRTFAARSASDADATYAELVAAVRAGVLPESVASELRAAILELLAGAPGGLAVRSSAVVEDSSEASFAGVFESWVGLTSRAEVERRVRDCWCAAWAPRALRYMARMGIEPRADAMAVMLQEVVPAVCSGVVTTADPDTGDPWTFVVRATKGLSLDLMSGSGEGDSFRVEWDTGAVTERELAPHPSPLATDDGLLAELTGVARCLDEAFGVRLDIEFAFAPDGLRIVQARPLTALPPCFPHELSAADRELTWQLAPVVLPIRGDVPAGFLTPLYRDLSEPEMWARYQPEDIVLAVFCEDSRDACGYRYNLVKTPRLFSSFFDDPSGYEAWLDRNEAGYRRRWDRHGDELRAIAAAARAAIAGTETAGELVPAMLDARERLWDLNAFGWSGPQSLGWMCDGLLGFTLRRLEPGLETGPIVGGGLDSYTFAVTAALQELGRAIHEPEIRRAFETLPLDEVAPHVEHDLPRSEFRAAYEAFCWRLGKRPSSWRDRPGFWAFSGDEVGMMHTIRCAMDGTSRDVAEVQRASLAARDEREREVRGMLASRAPDLVPRFDKMLEWTRYWGRALNDRHGLSRGLVWERELVWHVGARMRDEGWIEAPEDVLALRREDLEALADGAPRATFTGVVGERLRELRRNLRIAPPETIGAAPVPAPGAAPPPPPAEPAQAPVPDARRLTGVGIGHARVTGVARLVPDLSDPALLDALRPGDILVLPHAYAFHYADWHSLLTLVAGVVTPGQPSHHLAQVARECGVPVIAHVKGDLGRIEDGMRLELDARRGRVELL